MKARLPASLLAAYLLLTACTAAPPAGPRTIDVSGLVVGGPGQPVFGAKVILNRDPGKVITTGPDGKFTFDDVQAPYDLGVLTGNTFKEFRGLERTSIRIESPDIQYRATFAGKVSGVAYPLPAGQAIYLQARNANLFATVSPVNGTYSGTAIWNLSPPATTDLVAVLVKPGPAGSSLVDEYLLSGKRTGIPLSHGVNQTGLDVVLANPVPTTSTTVTLSNGAYSQENLAVLQGFAIEGVTFSVPDGTAGGIPNGATVKVPSAGATFQLLGSTPTGIGAAVVRAAVPGGTTQLALPATNLLNVLAPAPDATGLALTPSLTWTPVSGATQYSVTLSGNGKTYDFYLPGSASSLVVPDLSFLGMGLAANTEYSWAISAWSDENITPAYYVDPAVNVFDNSFLASTATLTMGLPDRMFRTAP